MGALGGHRASGEAKGRKGRKMEKLSLMWPSQSSRERVYSRESREGSSKAVVGEPGAGEEGRRGGSG